MLILASVLLLRPSNIVGSFSSTPDAVFSSNFPRDADPTLPCPRQRIQIIWTCVATILAASWVSVHPNIPNPKESTIMKMLRRVELMAWAIISPELMIYWAMGQWYGARAMERKFAEVQHADLEPWTRKILRRLKQLGYQLRHFRETPRRIKEVKWTRTHGFFLQMGGFMLREEGKEDRVLGWRTLMEYYKQGRLDLSEVTEDRINDHSKADWVAKGLALLQTFWFITQCIARFFDKDLILTELELATAALALLSLIMYFLWWNKPFNVRVPITIILLPAETGLQSKDNSQSRLEFVADSIDTSLPIADAVNPNVSHAQPVEATHPSDHIADEATPSESVETNPPLCQSDPTDPPIPHLESAEVSNVAFSQVHPSLPPNPQCAHPQVQSVSGSQPADRLPRSPTMESNKSSHGFQLWFLFKRIEEILKNIDADSVHDPDNVAVACVASFYSVEIDPAAVQVQMQLMCYSAAALFGSIHCIGWLSTIVFTSYATSLAWRIASVIITASPVVWCLAFIFGYLYHECQSSGSVLEVVFNFLSWLFSFVTVVTIPVYIVSRLALLVLAFIELRHIPPGALASLQWANVLPFIH